MSPLHRLLERQLRRYGSGLGDDDRFSPLLSAVSSAYAQADQDRALLERSLEISSGELLETNTELRAVVRALPDHILSIHRDGRIHSYKDGVGSRPFHHGELNTDSTLRQIATQEIATRLELAVNQVLLQKNLIRIECRHQVGDSLRHFEVRMAPLDDMRVLALIRDTSDLVHTRERNEYLASFDVLTGLPNRSLLKEKLSRAIKRGDATPARTAVITISLDRFKHINETLGLAFGDELLVTVAKRIRGCLRDTDVITVETDDADTTGLGRMGSDEFTAILGDIVDVHGVARICHRILMAIGQPMVIRSTDVFMTASIGVALNPDDGTDADTLIRNANAAARHARSRGSSNYQFYAQQMNSAAFERLQIETRLRRAVEADEFDLYYQPQVDVATGRVVGSEALLRWTRSTIGVIGPDKFIPIAEETDLILKIDEWVIQNVCRQVRAWLDMGLAVGRIYINISAKHFPHSSLVRKVDSALKHYAISSNFLGVEITETAALADEVQTRRTIDRLHDLGVKVALDDFGQGHSAIAVLRRFPLDSLKIDRDFLQKIDTHAHDAELTRLTILMGHALGLRVVAEGVETVHQLSMLRTWGCDAAQGYYLGKPVPAKDFVKLMELPLEGVV